MKPAKLADSSAAHWPTQPIARGFRFEPHRLVARHCIAVVAATVVIVATAALSKAVALAMTAVLGVLALRSLLRFLGDPIAEVLLTLMSYPGTRAAHGDPEGSEIAAGRALECIFYVCSLVVVSPLLYA